MSVIRRLLFVLLFVAASAAPAIAQESGKFALGYSVGVRIPTDSSAVRGNKAIGISWRVGHAKEGWGWKYGLGWFSTDAGWVVGGQNTELGELKVRPFMGGYGYTHLMGRYAITGQIVGGPAWTRLHAHPPFLNAYQNLEGVSVSDVDSGITLAVRPGMSIWYDVNKKFGINISAHYTIVRPNITVTSPVRVDARRLNADMFIVQVGVVYSIF